MNGKQESEKWKNISLFECCSDSEFIWFFSREFPIFLRWFFKPFMFCWINASRELNLPLSQVILSRRRFYFNLICANSLNFFEEKSSNIENLSYSLISTIVSFIVEFFKIYWSRYFFDLVSLNISLIFIRKFDDWKRKWMKNKTTRCFNLQTKLLRRIKLYLMEKRFLLASNIPHLWFENQFEPSIWNL